MKNYLILSATLILFICLLATTNFAAAQNNNIYLDGDNYITLSNPAFQEKVSWTGFSESRPGVAQQPVLTYWFTHNGKSHIVIHLKDDQSEIFIELSRNKKIYQFPKEINYSPSDDADYHFNDFHLYVTDKSGVVRKFSFGKNAHITIHVQQLDPSHLKVDFEGTISYYAHPQQYENGPLSSPMAITGKISLSKKNPGLQHLTDSYNGCDNTIYNEVSPNWRLGQFRSATQCEESFYKKVYVTLNEALKPLAAYFESQGWTVTQTTFQPLDIRLKNATNKFFVTHQLPVDVDYTLTANANPNKGAYGEYMQRAEQNLSADIFKNGQLDTVAARKQMQFAEEGKEFGLNLTVYLNRPLTSEEYSQHDAGNIPLGKLNGATYLIRKIISNNLQQTTYYDAYVLIGNWQAPRWNDDHAIAVDMNPSQNAKGLSIQALYIDLDCGKNLAATAMKHLNMDALRQLLKITP